MNETGKMAESENRFVYTINGVKVVFPCKAYPTQLSMMNMVGISHINYGLFYEIQTKEQLNEITIILNFN